MSSEPSPFDGAPGRPLPGTEYAEDAPAKRRQTDDIIIHCVKSSSSGVTSGQHSCKSIMHVEPILTDTKLRLTYVRM